MGFSDRRPSSSSVSVAGGSPTPWRKLDLRAALCSRSVTNPMFVSKHSFFFFFFNCYPWFCQGCLLALPPLVPEKIWGKHTIFQLRTSKAWDLSSFLISCDKIFILLSTAQWGCLIMASSLFQIVLIARLKCVFTIWKHCGRGPTFQIVLFASPEHSGFFQ
jgi:hypothetical protein